MAIYETIKRLISCYLIFFNTCAYNIIKIGFILTSPCDIVTRWRPAIADTGCMARYV